MSKQILIVTEYFYPDERTDAFLITQIVEKLALQDNNNVEVICTSNLNGRKELDVINGKITRLKKNSLSEKKIISRTIKFLFLTFKLSIASLFKIKKNTNVLITTNPIFLMLVFSCLKVFKRFNYTLLVYDVFPENLVAANLLSKKTFLFKIINYIYNWAYSKTDKLIVLGRDMEEIMKKKAPSSKIIIIENWCDVKKVTPKAKESSTILKQLNLLDKKIFLFAGNLGRVQGIQTLLEASKLVKDKNFILLFIGDGIYKNKIIDFAKNNSKNNVYYGGSFPIKEQNTFLNSCDVAIISLGHKMFGLGVPSKSYCNMAAGKAILYLGDSQSEIARVIDEFKIGWHLEANNPELLSKKIDNILINQEKINIYGINSRKCAEKYFSKEVILEKYQQLF